MAHHLHLSHAAGRRSGDVKRYVANRLVQSKQEMKQMTMAALRRTQKLPELVKSFFRQPECRYIHI